MTVTIVERSVTESKAENIFKKKVSNTFKFYRKVKFH